MSERGGAAFTDNRPLVAVTGATGFIGRSLIARLAAQGAGVRALARPGPGRSLEHREGVCWAEGRLEDAASLEAFVAGADSIVHLAGATRGFGTEDFHRDNVIATSRLALAARRAGARHFVHVSSLAARRPEVSAYAASKAASEAAARAGAGAMTLVIVRPPAVTGPGDTASGPLFALIAKGLLPAPPQAADRMFSIIDVEDLARYLAGLALDMTVTGLVEPCSVERVSWPELAAAAGRATGHRVRLVTLPAVTWHLAGWLSGLSGLITGRPSHFGPGKVRELLSRDWTCGPVIPESCTLEKTLGRSLGGTDIAA